MYILHKCLSALLYTHVHSRTPGGHVGAKATWRAVHAQYPEAQVSLQTAQNYVEACAICQKARNIKQPIETRNMNMLLFRVSMGGLILRAFWHMAHAST